MMYPTITSFRMKPAAGILGDDMARTTRAKLFHGAVILHSTKGELVIRVTHQPDVNPPVVWEAIYPDGSLAAPLAYDELGLHRILKWRSTYTFK